MGAGAYEGFCLRGGTNCARKCAKKILGVPPLATVCPPLKNRNCLGDVGRYILSGMVYHHRPDDEQTIPELVTGDMLYIFYSKYLEYFSQNQIYIHSR